MGFKRPGNLPLGKTHAQLGGSYFLRCGGQSVHTIKRCRIYLPTHPLYTIYYCLHQAMQAARWAVLLLQLDCHLPKLLVLLENVQLARSTESTESIR